MSTASHLSIAGFTLAITLAAGCTGDGGARDPDDSNDPADPGGLPEECDEVGVICTVAGTGETGFAPDEAPALESDIGIPIDVAAAPDGTIYVVDFNNSCIRAFDREAGTLTRVIGSSELAPGEVGCPGGGLGCDALDLSLNHPTAMAFDGDDAIIALPLASVLFRVNLASGEVTARYGAGTRGPYTGDGGPASEAAFNYPTSVAVDPEGGVVVLDQMNQVIRRIGPDGIVERMAGSCVVQDPLGEPCADDAELVACPDSHKLTCGDPATTCDGLCTPGFAGDGGPALDARFGFTVGQSTDMIRLAIMLGGTLVVADTLNHRVRTIDRRGVVFTSAGTGERGFGDGRLNLPVDVAVGPDGTVYIADSANHCVQAVTRGGELTRVVGLCGYRGFEGDGGPALDARLSLPFGVEVADGVLYIADAGNHRIRAVRLE
jgi:adhesin/invasin